MKGFWNSTSIIPNITLSFIFFFICYFEDVLAVPPTKQHFLCRPEQRDALLAFKNEFQFGEPKVFCPGNRTTESWGNHSDCCSWEGITCNAKSGDVVELDLSCIGLYGRFQSNSSLQNLLFLTTFDLSYNNLTGQIPDSIINLSNLISLKLSRNHLIGRIPSYIGNFTQLTYLDLSFNQFSGEIPYSIGNLSLLTSLDLFGNNLVGEIPSSFGNLNQLTNLYVGLNMLSGKFPNVLLNLTGLSYLSLSDNQFSGALPLNITSLSNLRYFVANGNAFTGTIHSSLFTIPSLTYIILSDNQLNGTLEFGNTSSSPSNLEWLEIGRNNFKGPIPRSISKFVNLSILDLSHFDTQGRPVDFSIFSHLKSLQSLDISYLNTTTTIDMNDILSYSKSLSELDLSGNHVSTTNKISVSNPPSQEINTLRLSGCGITEFPELLRTQHRMTNLDISNNKIEGQVPGWLWTLPNLGYVNLSNNTFIGFQRAKKKQGLSSVRKLSMQYLLGSNNNFTGKIPSFICEFPSLDTLDLSKNKFNGSIPHCLGNLKSNLSVLNLRQNNLSGGLPEDIIFESLRSLDVGHNQLVGKLPRSLNRFSTLEVLNVESSRINDTFLFWLGSLQKLQVLVLRSNAFHGPIHQASFPQLRIIDISNNHFDGTLPSDYFSKWTAMSSLGTDEDQYSDKYMRGDTGYYYDSLVLMNKGVELELVRILKIYTAINFSGNKFEGEIPKSIGLLEELRVLNLANNAFTGRIPSSMGNLTVLESLDVSQNKLSGEIPKDLGNLSFLAYMSVSKNKFTEKIPSFLCVLRSLGILDLSNNNFSGSIPRCIGNLKSTLAVLNLRQNNLSGGLPEHIFESLRSLDVGHNQLVGKLPRSLIRFRNLEILNMESNKIMDTFPFWLSSLQKLQVLVLRSNAFHGPIHQVFFPKLRIVDISHNHFNGTLPSDYFVKWSAMSSLGADEDRSSVNYMGSSIYYQDSMVLMSKGVMMELVRILTIYTAIDFSGNKFEGEIPKSIGLLKELHVLNVSNNAFTGNMPSSMGNLTALESLDVSLNKLSGEIPKELGDLSFLEYMNFSHNQLSGLVPGGTQFRTQSCSSFGDNPGLVASSLEKVCRDIHTPLASYQQYETSESEEEDEEEVISWIAAAIGFVPGIVSGLTFGYILVSHKPEWFMNPFGRNNRRRRITTTQ